MNILRAYKRTRFYLWINIIGLAIGLLASTMLILFVVNELNCDKGIKDSDRIITLHTVMENNGNVDRLPIATRQALTDIPQQVPNIEAVTQIYDIATVDLKYENENFLGIRTLMTESGFCEVFSLEFITGNKDVLNVPFSLVVTDRYAETIFGSVEAALHKKVILGADTYIVGGVVKDFPKNTHFRFGILMAMHNGVKDYPSIEFFTFYKIEEGVSIDHTRTAIEKEYTIMVTEFLKDFVAKSYGVTEKFTDIYLKTAASNTLGKRSSMAFVWMLSTIAIFILLLAIVNFVNLFMVQGEARMQEIGIRKVNGASVMEIAKQFFFEIFVVVLTAFVIGLLLLIVCIPYFAKLIDRDIDLVQLYSPSFIIAIILLLAVTVILSAAYPTFYLTRFNTLDILAKRIRFSKRKLTSLSITFQAIVSIVIIAFILTINNQTHYLRQQPLGYNPENVLVLQMNENIHKQYDAIKQELEKRPGIVQIAVAHHRFGGGASGQGISLSNADNQLSISEYRIHLGICEMMELQLVEGTFYETNGTTNERTIILNESAIKALGLTYPVVGTTIDYKGLKEIRGVVKDFYYNQIENPIEPMVLSYIPSGGSIYIKYANMNRQEVQGVIREVFSQFDSFYILHPTWLEDTYNQKFDNLTVQSHLLMLASLLAIFISMIGLVAIHMFGTVRRRKEIAIRRINGASQLQIFRTLSTDVMKWMLIAGCVSVPFVYYFAADWLSNYANHVALGFGVFAIPIIIQYVIAITVTSSVSIKALGENPVKSLKTE